MNAQNKKRVSNGALVLSMAGVTTVLSVTDAKEWLDLFAEKAWTVAILGLVWWIYRITLKHEDCQSALVKAQKQCGLLYSMAKETLRNSDDLPDEEEFMEGKFSHDEVLRKVRRKKSTRTVAPQDRRGED